jgi:hypothetical protein
MWILLGEWRDIPLPGGRRIVLRRDDDKHNSPADKRFTRARVSRSTISTTAGSTPSSPRRTGVYRVFQHVMQQRRMDLLRRCVREPLDQDSRDTLDVLDVGLLSLIGLAGMEPSGRRQRVAIPVLVEYSFSIVASSDPLCAAAGERGIGQGPGFLSS